MFHNCSLMLQSDTYKSEGGQFVLLDDKNASLHAGIQSTAPDSSFSSSSCLLLLIPLSSYLRHPSPPPPTLCSIFRIFLNYLMLPPLLPSFLPPPLSSAVLTYPSFLSGKSSPPSFLSCSLCLIVFSSAESSPSVHHFYKSMT